MTILKFFENFENFDIFEKNYNLDIYVQSRYPPKMMTAFMNSPRQLFAHDGAHPWRANIISPKTKI